MQRTLVITAVAASLLLALAPAAAEAATAKSYNKFTIPRSYQVSVDWYEANRADVLNASNCRIVKHLGDGQYKCQTNTPLGACVFVLKETRQDTGEEGQRATTYRLTFVRNVSGRVTYQQVIIKLSEAGEKTQLQMWMTTSVAGRFVPVFAVSRVQQGSLYGCQRYVLKHAAR
jgi:hypothetical protein